MTTRRKARDYGWLKHAATLGGHAKWAGTSAEERSAHAVKMTAARNAKLSPARRRAIARAAVIARWIEYYRAHPEKQRPTRTAAR